jgi:sugar lactone lactonase YvrE
MHSTRRFAITAALLGCLSMSAITAPPVLASGGHTAAGASAARRPSVPRLLVSGLAGTIGGTIGPDGALYVPEAGAGRITRVDPRTGATSTFADGLPAQVIPLGGAMDVKFVGKTAYVLVTLVSSDLGGTNVDGIYRIDDQHHATVIADIGAFSVAHPPVGFPFEVPTGLQYALEPVPGGFLVSDGHHNRLLHVTRRGRVSELLALPDVVPTGLAVTGRSVLFAETGPVPYKPEDGKIMELDKHGRVHELASGYSVMVDVALGPDHQVYAISQGDEPDPPVQPADPAKPDTGRLLRLNHNGTFTVVVDHLNLPTSVHFVGNAALIVTLGGEVWRVPNATHHARAHHDHD